MKKQTEITTDNTQSQHSKMNNHFALRKLKDVEQNIETMKRRFKVLKVKDDENRSKTIQHQNKLKFHEEVQKQMHKDKEKQQKYEKEREQEIEVAKEKNHKLKLSLEQKVKKVYQTISKQKQAEFKKAKKEHRKNQHRISKQKKEDHEQKYQRRKLINIEEENQRARYNRYKTSRIKYTIETKVNQSDEILNKALKKQKQLQMLSKMEEEMLLRNSQSIQASLQMRNNLRKVLGDERRFTKLPTIKGDKSRSTSVTDNAF